MQLIIKEMEKNERESGEEGGLQHEELAIIL